MSAQMPGEPLAPPPVHGHVRNNGLAITSMVLGLVGILFFVLFAIIPILAVIFGLVARKQIADSAGTQQGSGMAVAGIVLGAIETVVFFVLLATGGGSFYINFG